MADAEYLSDSEIEAFDLAVREAEEAAAKRQRRSTAPDNDIQCVDIEDLADDGSACQPDPCLPNLIRRNNVVWVTDLTSTEWCGLQVQYQVGGWMARMQLMVGAMRLVSCDRSRKIMQ